MTPHEYAELLDQCSKLFRSIVVSTAFPRPKSRQPIFLDGILHTASNALRNVGIHLAARKAGFSENAKLLLYEDRPVHQLYESLDIAKFRIGLTKPSMAERIKNRLIRISPWPFDKKKIFDERYKNIQLGNYALDTAIRYLPNAFTISQIPKRTALTLRSSARRMVRTVPEIA